MEDQVPTIWQAIAQVGLAVALVPFFIWRDWDRDKRSQKRHEEMEKFQRETLMELVANGQQALTTNSETLKRTVEILERIERVLEAKA